MKRAIMVLTLSLIVGWASTAAAECAWVLWAQVTVQNPKLPSRASIVWTVESGYPTHGECTTGRDKQFRHFAAVLRADPGVKDFTQNPSNAALGYTSEGRNKTFNYSCLPDTIDPREKKG